MSSSPSASESVSQRERTVAAFGEDAASARPWGQGRSHFTEIGRERASQANLDFAGRDDGILEQSARHDLLIRPERADGNQVFFLRGICRSLDDDSIRSLGNTSRTHARRDERGIFAEPRTRSSSCDLRATPRTLPSPFT